MTKWFDAKQCVPNHEELVEIACFIGENSAPYWRLSHAWYNQIGWIRKDNETWEIQFWRDSVKALEIEKPWKEDSKKETNET